MKKVCVSVKSIVLFLSVVVGVVIWKSFARLQVGQPVLQESQSGYQSIQDIAKNFLPTINAVSFEKTLARSISCLGYPALESLVPWGAPILSKKLEFSSRVSYATMAVCSPDSKKVAQVFGRTLVVWDLATGALVHVLSGHTSLLVNPLFSVDGAYLFAVSLYDGTVKIWDVETGQCVDTFSGISDVGHVVRVCCDESRLLIFFSNKTVRVYNFRRKGWYSYRLELPEAIIKSAQFDQSGRTLITISGEEAVLWKVENGKPLHTLRHTAAISCAAFSPDGLQMATGSTDTTTKIRDVQTGRCVHVLLGHTAKIFSLYFSPNGSRLVSLSMDGTAKVWDVQSGSCLYTLQTCRKVSSDPDDLRNTFISASFSSDGTILVTLNPEGLVRLWNVETGQCMLTIDRFGTDSFFYEAYLTADTSKLVISGTNSTEIWDFRVRVSAAEKIMYDAFVASGLSRVENAQITNPYALQLLQKLNRRAAPGSELIPGITQPNLFQRARALIGPWFAR